MGGYSTQQKVTRVESGGGVDDGDVVGGGKKYTSPGGILLKNELWKLF